MNFFDSGLYFDWEEYNFIYPLLQVVRIRIRLRKSRIRNHKANWTDSVVVVYHATILAIRQRLLTHFCSMVIGCVLRTARSCLIFLIMHTCVLYYNYLIIISPWPWDKKANRFNIYFNKYKYLPILISIFNRINE